MHSAKGLYAAGKEGGKEGQIWPPLCCLAPQKLSMILLRAPERCKIERLPLKERKHSECRC